MCNNTLATTARALLNEWATGGNLGECARELAKAVAVHDRTYTVISHDDDTGEVMIDHIEADDEHEAMQRAAKDRDYATIICAIPGEHYGVCACEDAGRSAEACDLLQDEEAEETANAHA